MTGGPTFGVGRIRWGWFIVGCVVVLLLPAVTGTNTPALLLIWALFALSLGLMWGFAGILSFGHAAYFGLGAYTYAIAAMTVGESTGPLLLAIVLPAAVGGGDRRDDVLRPVSDVYLGVITLVVTLILFKFMNATAGDAYRIGASLGGFNGIPAFPILNLPGDPSVTAFGTPFYYVVCAALLLCYLLCRWILGSLLRQGADRHPRERGARRAARLQRAALQDGDLHDQRRRWPGSPGACSRTGPRS
jgi:branched-chain amino acid transport system permease protein